MIFDLTASETSPLSLSEHDVAALAACGHGTILLDVAARADATLIVLTGTNGRITLSLRAGRLDGEQVLGAVGRPEGPSGAGSAGGIQRRILDAEDALGLDADSDPQRVRDLAGDPRRPATAAAHAEAAATTRGTATMRGVTMGTAPASHAPGRALAPPGGEGVGAVTDRTRLRRPCACAPGEGSG